jgi:hypothetical protein
MGRITAVIAVAAGLLALTDCGGGGGMMTPAIDPVNVYLARLNTEQARLAAAERAIPAHPRTPATFSSSIALLARAVGGLGGDLASIQPPAAVAADHRRLVSIVGAYAAELQVAAQGSRSRAGELRAGSRILAATTTASTAFSATVARIHAVLGR